MTARWLLPLVFLGACTQAPHPAVSPGSPPPAAIAASPAASVAPEMVAGLAFRPPTDQQMDFLERLYTQNWNGWSCRAVARAYTGGGWGPVSIYSGNYDFNFTFGLFPEGDTHLAGKALTTAEMAGGTGEAALLVDTIVKPVVAAWAADAELARDFQGTPDFTSDAPEPAWVKDELAIITRFGWPLAYRSRARREILNFHIDADRMLVVRTTFDGPVPTEAQVAIDRQAAIVRAQTVLKDPRARSWEERTGRDYFSGLPYRPHQPGDPVGTSNTIDLAPVYELPDNLTWRADLFGFYAGKPMWQVYSQGAAQPSPVASIPVGSTLTFVGYETETWIDANTGEAIRFRRPQRSTVAVVASVSPWIPPSP